MSRLSKTMELGGFFLDRFERFARLRAGLAPVDHPVVRLLDHALYSTYHDCVRLGLSSQARELARVLLDH